MFLITPAKILLTAALALAAVFLGSFDTLYAWQWQHIQLHSTIETLGGITACLISVMLFIRSQEKLDAQLVMLATGFAGMGVLDTAQAICFFGYWLMLCMFFFFFRFWAVRFH